MKFKAIIFDCDGTMFDTETLSILSFTKTAEIINYQLPDDFFENIMGTTSKHIANYINSLPEIGPELPNIVKLWHDLIDEACMNKDSLNKKGLIELLNYLFTNNYKVAIASSSNINHIQKLLDHMTNKYQFDAIISGTQVKNSKPAPDIFLKVAEILNVQPSECLVLEDSKNGIKAAKNACMTNIFIKDVIEFDTDDYQYVDNELEDLSKVIDYLKENK